MQLILLIIKLKIVNLLCIITIENVINFYNSILIIKLIINIALRCLRLFLLILDPLMLDFAFLLIEDPLFRIRLSDICKKNCRKNSNIHTF